MLLSSRNSGEEHHKAILQHTRAILFLGTPHHGSGLARWAAMLAKYIGLAKQTNPEIVRVLERDSETLARIQTDFHTMLRSQSLGQGGQVPLITIICFYEEMPLPGIGEVCIFTISQSGLHYGLPHLHFFLVQVVPMDSAILPAYPSVGIHTDHIGMTKFESKDDPGFVSVEAELLRIARNARAEPLEVANKSKETSVATKGLEDIASKDTLAKAAGSPAAKLNDGNTGPVHIGDNYQSNALYGGTQTFQGDVRFGGST
jgi:hypothetical protein